MDVNPEGLIPIMCGAFAWFIATGRYNPSKDPVKSEAWLLRWRPVLKVLAPLVILLGMAQLMGFV